MPELTGTATVTGYFEDRLLMILDLEARGDRGLAEVTVTALINGADRAPGDPEDRSPAPVLSQVPKIGGLHDR